MGRLAPSVTGPADAEGYCEQECAGIPPITGGLYGTYQHQTRHWHHACWSCGGEVITRMSMTYTCKTCGVDAGPACTTSAHPEFDPEYAATHGSP